MRPWRVGVGTVVVGVLVLFGAGAPAAPVGSAGLNHAAVVIDTGDGTVRKFCLAFPEEAISGAEALRRIESDVVFASYGSKGQAVCSLCAVGCPAGDCFCDPSKYWAYHRAGPGGAPYQASRVGVSATEVRNGDVEGWRWGGGQAPPRATVGEVCDVPEPPARTTSSGSGGAAPASTTTPTTAAPAPAPAPDGGATPATTMAPGATPAGPTATPTPSGPRPTAPGPTVVPAAPAPPGALGPADEVAPPSDGSTTSTAAVPVAEAGDDSDRRRSLAADPTVARRSAEGGGAGGPLSVAAFVAVLVGVLVWRARLRRANVRS